MTDRPAKRVEEIWGTVVSVDVRDPVAGGAVDACFDWFQHVDDLFSTWRDDTEIMRIGRGELAIDDASPEVRTVVELCEQMRLESGGAFDIAVGTHPKAPERPGRRAARPVGARQRLGSRARR